MPELFQTIVQPELPKQQAPKLEPTLEASVFIGAAVLIGMGHYLYRVATEELKFTWMRLFAEAMLSGSAGYLSLALCTWAGLSGSAIGFLTGLSGYAGAKALRFLETVTMKVVNKQLGITDEDTDKK